MAEPSEKLWPFGSRMEYDMVELVLLSFQVISFDQIANLAAYSPEVRILFFITLVRKLGILKNRLCYSLTYYRFKWIENFARMTFLSFRERVTLKG